MVTIASNVLARLLNYVLAGPLDLFRMIANNPLDGVAGVRLRLRSHVRDRAPMEGGMKVTTIVAIAAMAIGALYGMGSGSLGGALLVAIVFGLLLEMNFIPTIVAYHRRHEQRLLIGVLNFITSIFPLPLLLIGNGTFATLIVIASWIALLIWACTGTIGPYQPSALREIEDEVKLYEAKARLAQLKREHPDFDCSCQPQEGN